MRSPYPLLLPPFVAAIVGKSLEQWLGDQAWWKALPWGWITVVTGALILGALWADVRNPESALRARWRERRKVFELRAAYIQEALQPHAHYEIVCVFRVLRDLGPCRLIVRVTELTRPNRTHVVHDEEFSRLPKDHERRLRLGSVAITKPGESARYSVWGEQLGSTVPSGQAGIPGAGRCLVDVQLAGQTYRVLVAACPPKMHGDPPPYYVLTEDEFPRRAS